MSKLIITADIHGHYPAWRTIIKELGVGDGLAIAGDLFGTRYIHKNRTVPELQPERIRHEIESIENCYYVYGNCDTESFYPGQKTHCSFQFHGYTFFLSHGHLPRPDITDTDIIIEGHTHIARLDSVMGKVFLNPGSPVLPRRDGPSYAIFQRGKIGIYNMKTKKECHTLEL